MPPKTAAHKKHILCQEKHLRAMVLALPKPVAFNPLTANVQYIGCKITFTGLEHWTEVLVCFVVV